MQQTMPVVLPRDEGQVRYRLVILSDMGVGTRDLPASGPVVIGRAEDCDVTIDAGSLSRQHARLELGPQPTIEDLGSSNGTLLKKRKLEKGERAVLGHGDSIELGSVTLVLQRDIARRPGRPRRLFGHDYFEARLEEECERAAQTGMSFCVMRLKLEGTGSPSAAQEALCDVLAATDVIAAYGPGEYEAIVFGAKPAAVLEELEKALAERSTPSLIGHAVWGADGRDPDELLAVACGNVEGAPAPKAAPTKTVVKDKTMQALYELASRVASSSISVLLLGETGTGKEVLAEHIHKSSQRKDGPFVRLNCAALSETLLESELFGHKEGAFTGAVRAKIGLLESANGGTVLLDEIGELPAATQVKLLRVIEQREVLRVGDVKPRPIDVRFVSATHRDLEQLAAANTFRTDLFFRLNGVSLTVPPLRDRIGELEYLAQHFVSLSAAALGRPAPALSDEALDLLRGYHWPGNLRELRNVLERATLLCSTPVIVPEDLPAEKLGGSTLVRRRSEAAAGPSADPEADAQRARIIAALETNGGNQTLAAQQLGISRRTMLNWLDAHGIPRPRKGK